MGLMDRMKDAASQAVSQTQQGIDKAKGDFASSRGDDPVVGGGGSTASTSPSGPRPILEVVSHIDGRNSKVRLWPDRLEWEKGRGMSAGKITAGLLTAGTSLLVTGVKGGKDEHDVVLLKHVTNVSSRKDGLMYYAVDVQTSTGAVVNTVSFRVSRDEVAQFRNSVLSAMQQLDAQTNTVVIQNAAPPTPPAPPAPVATAPDPTTQLQQLAGLRDAGILTEAEFSAKKADILARM